MQSSFERDTASIIFNLSMLIVELSQILKENK